jgi:hypothetical protein
MQAESGAQLLGIQWAGCAERRKQLELDRAQQRLGAPKRKSQLQDRAGSRRLGSPGRSAGRRDRGGCVSSGASLQKVV